MCRPAPHGGLQPLHLARGRVLAELDEDVILRVAGRPAMLRRERTKEGGSDSQYDAYRDKEDIMSRVTCLRPVRYLPRSAANPLAARKPHCKKEKRQEARVRPLPLSSVTAAIIADEIT